MLFGSPLLIAVILLNCTKKHEPSDSKIKSFNSAFSSEENFMAYNLNGEPLGFSFSQIDSIIENSDLKGRVHEFKAMEHGYADNTWVSYKLFTDSILWVFTRYPDSIETALGKFDLDEFMNSIYFNARMDIAIEEGNIDMLYISKTLGKPTSIGSKDIDGKYHQVWTYYDLGMSIIFKGTTAVKQESVYNEKLLLKKLLLKTKEADL